MLIGFIDIFRPHYVRNMKIALSIWLAPLFKFRNWDFRIDFYQSEKIKIIVRGYINDLFKESSIRSMRISNH